jgi:hypothetical protein
MKKIYVSVFCAFSFVMCFSLLHAAGLRFGMTAAVKEQAKKVDKKVIEQTAAAQARGISLLGRANGLASSPARRAPGVGTPRVYKVALASCQLAKSLDDATPYSIFNVELADARVFNLIGSAVSMSSNSEYPAAGTYNYIKVKMLYLEQGTTITGLPNAGENNILFRSYFSTLTGIRDKFDMLISADNGTTWQWVDKGQSPWALVNTKPADPLLQPGLDTIGWSPTHDIYLSALNPAEFLMPLSEPLVIPENPTGRWVLTMTFNTANNVNWDNDDGNGILDVGEAFFGSAPSTTITFAKE